MYTRYPHSGYPWTPTATSPPSKWTWVSPTGERPPHYGSTLRAKDSSELHACTTNLVAVDLWLLSSCFSFVSFCRLKLVRVENLPFGTPKNLLTAELSIHHGSAMIHSARTTETRAQDSFTMTWNEDVTFIIPLRHMPKVSNIAW